MRKEVRSFCLDPGDLISYVFKSRPWWERIVAIANNSKEFDLLFVLNRLVQIMFVPEILVMKGQIMS